MSITLPDVPCSFEQTRGVWQADSTHVSSCISRMPISRCGCAGSDIESSATRAPCAATKGRRRPAESTSRFSRTSGCVTERCSSARISVSSAAQSSGCSCYRFCSFGTHIVTRCSIAGRHSAKFWLGFVRFRIRLVRPQRRWLLAYRARHARRKRPSTGLENLGSRSKKK